MSDAAADAPARPEPRTLTLHRSEPLAAGLRASAGERRWRSDAWPLAIAGLGAWMLLLSSSAVPVLPLYCGAYGQFWDTLPAGIELALRITPPGQLLLSWLLMLCAMMLPLLERPIAAIRAQAPPRLRAPALLVFLAAYMTVWIVAALPIALMVSMVKLATAPLAAEPIAALAVALAWQWTPIKQSCLERCRLGLFLDRDSRGLGYARYGIAVGGACVGSCWALMALPLLFGSGHLAAMAGAFILMLGERYGGARHVPAGSSKAS